MKKIMLVLCLWIFILAAQSFAQPAEIDEIITIPVGNMKVTGLLDKIGNMEKTLLTNIKDYPELEKYFDNGPLPSVTRCYFLEDNGHSILIDTGWGKELDDKSQLAENLQKAKIDPASITDILLTHMDFDHIGGLINNKKAVFPNATIWISRPEFEAWMQGNVSQREDWAVTLAKMVGELYKDKIRLFEFDDQLFPNVKALNASGHTPGHTAYSIRDKGDQLIIGGDFAHVSPLQILQPDLSTKYDMNPEQAAKARTYLLEQASREKSKIAGMHIPDTGTVQKQQQQGYKIIPADK